MLLEASVLATCGAITWVSVATSPRSTPRELCTMEEALGGPEAVVRLLAQRPNSDIQRGLRGARIAFVHHPRGMPKNLRSVQSDWCHAWHSVNGEYYYFDALGRPSRALTLLPQLRPRRGVRSAHAQGAVGRWGDLNGAEDYDGAHLIAAQLGGYGRRANLVPKAKELNRGAWRSVEQAVVKALPSLHKQQLAYYVRANYGSGNSLIPLTIGLYLWDRHANRARYIEFKNSGHGGLLAWLSKRHAYEFLRRTQTRRKMRRT